MTKIEKMTESEWRDVASQVIKCQEEWSHLLDKINGKVSVKTLDRWKKVEVQISSYKSHLEDEMFKRGGLKDIQIFYPGQKK